jgi:hypothetical protein
MPDARPIDATVGPNPGEGPLQSDPSPWKSDLAADPHVIVNGPHRDDSHSPLNDSTDRIVFASNRDAVGSTEL